MVVPTFRALTLGGDSVTIGATPGRRQVLLFFTTTCPYCLASLPAWRRIAAADSAEPTRFDLIGVSLDSAEQSSRYVMVHAVPFLVVMLPERKLARLYRASSVPLTMVLDSTGRVVYARLGQLPLQVADSVISAARGSAAQGPAEPATHRDSRATSPGP
jgi:peroxiredoxin